MDFPHYGDPLDEIVIFGASGHYLENVWEYMSRGGRRHISDALRRVLSSLIFFS